MTELRPGTSPPPVRMPIRFFAMATLLYQASEFVIPDEPQRRQVYAACASLAACGESRSPVTTAAVYWVPDSRALAAAGHSHHHDGRIAPLQSTRFPCRRKSLRARFS